MTSDPYYKKTISFNFQKQNLKFNLSQQLFSSFDVDQGSKLLLKTFANKNVHYKKTLDLGCGYGVIGLTLKKLNLTDEIHLVDRDALTTEYTKQNAILNLIENTKVYTSLGYDSIDEKFDLTVSNIPAKAGEPVLKSLLTDSKYFLNKNGIMAVVVVKELEDFVEQTLNKENVEIISKEKGKGHIVFHYQFSAVLKEKYKPAFERGIYDRGNLALTRTVYGLPEFDSLSFNTQLLLKNMQTGNDKNVLIYNPSQGHIALAIYKSLNPKTITLFDRDLLALENTKRNLLLQGFKNENLKTYHDVHTPEMETKNDLVIVILRDDDSPNIAQFLIENITENLMQNGIMILSGTSTQITRATYFIKTQKQLSIQDRKKWKGESTLILQKRI